MNSLRRLLDSVSSMTVVWFIIGSLFALLGNMAVQMPMVRYVGFGLLGVVLFLIMKNFVTLTKKEKRLLQNGVKYSRKNQEALEKLGEFRTSVKSNKVKIFIMTFFHALFMVYAVGICALMVAKKTEVIGIDAILLLVMAMLFGILPLRHLRDNIEYYTNGFIYNGSIYFYQKVGGIFFKNVHSPKTLTGMLIIVNGDMLDASYLKNAKRKYYETYYKRAVDPSQGN